MEGNGCWSKPILETCIFAEGRVNFPNNNVAGIGWAWSENSVEIVQQVSAENQLSLLHGPTWEVGCAQAWWAGTGLTRFCHEFQGYPNSGVVRVGTLDPLRRGQPLDFIYKVLLIGSRILNPQKISPHSGLPFWAEFLLCPQTFASAWKTYLNSFCFICLEKYCFGSDFHLSFWNLGLFLMYNFLNLQLVRATNPTSPKYMANALGAGEQFPATK